MCTPPLLLEFSLRRRSPEQLSIFGFFVNRMRIQPYDTSESDQHPPNNEIGSSLKKIGDLLWCEIGGAVAVDASLEGHQQQCEWDNAGACDDAKQWSAQQQADSSYVVAKCHAGS